MDVVNVLLRAARAGNLKRVLEIIEDDLVDINISNNNGLTALHSASKEGHTRVVEQLLARGANVHARTLKGNQPIHIASLAGHEPVVRVLLDHGADVNAQSTSGFTSLYMAAQENHEPIVRLLLERGADQNISTTDGFTPLAVSLQQNHENIAKILLNHEARGQVRFPGITDTGRSLLHVAAKKNDCAAAALLLQNNISPDVTSKSNFTSLHVACHYGNEAVAKLLIENGADVNFQAKQNITPLHVAARWNQLALVNLLLDYGAKIDAQTKDHLTPLHCAARMGHDACVELLIQRGAPISAKTRSRLVPLHMSAQGNHLRSAQILLNNRAPVDDVTIDHLTSLHVASHCGHVKVAKLLLDYNADPNIRAQNGFTSLHIACKKNHLDIVKLLLKYDASLKAVTESGLSCLHIASFMGCVEIVIYLLEHDAEIEAQTIRGETPLILATRSNQLEVIDVLLRYGANANACDQNHQNALHLSARLGNTKIARLLIEQGVNIDAPTRQMYTALHIASKENHQNVVALLLDNGANISCATKNHEFFPLHLASKYGNDKIVELLLNYGTPVDARGKNDVTSLMVASHYDHPKVVEQLLMFGASPHATAKNGYTAIHIAAKGNRIDCSNILLQNGADPNVESKAGFCPLHLASQEGRANMAALLLESGAHVNCRAKNGITPLHLCAQEDHVSVAQLLVKYGAYLDAQTRNGFTPLHVACHFTRVRMIRFLLANGANVNIPAACGYTSLHQASQQGNSQIVDMLLQYNAKPDALTDNGHSALSIAENLGHVSVIDTLRIVTETVIKTTKTTITEEKFKIVAPETMQETFISDSEDEADDTPAHQESVKFLTTDVMKSFSNTMADDNYNTSQSNLNAGLEQQQQRDAASELQRQASQHSNELLASAGGAGRSSRTTRIADEMSTDLQYLSREAPLDGGESTFGAYSTLGGGQSSQQLPTGDEPNQPITSTMTRETSYRSTVTRTSTTPLGDHEAPLSDDEAPQGQRLENDYERTDFRIEDDDNYDDEATRVYQYNQRMRQDSAGSQRNNATNQQQSFGDPQQQLEQLAPDNVDIQRPLQQAGSESSVVDVELNATTPTELNPDPAAIGGICPDSPVDQQQLQQREQDQLERLAEVSRLEIEHRDLDNAPDERDLQQQRQQEQQQPIQMVDSPESERTMAQCEAGQPLEAVGSEATPANLNAVSSDRQQHPNLQPVNLPLLKPFLVSFMVDARGGAMRGCRHSGVRVIIPPNTAPQPMRITCRYLRRERLVHPPPLMEGEACASKIMEVGPAGARFLGPVLIEVPHFASLRGKEREIIILRSDSGEVWREHLFETDDQLIDEIISAAELVEQQQNPYATGQDQDQDQENQRPSSAIGQSSQKSGFGGGGVGGGGDSQQERRLTRIVTNEFPQYFAIISRVRQEVHTVGPDGLVVDSQVVPRVQAIFTDGALTKRIKIGLQKKNGRPDGSTPEPNQQQVAEHGQTPDLIQERTRSPSRPNSAQAKRKSRFLACFGASHGSHDLLDQSGTDAEGFASGSNESSSSSMGGGDSPRQLANEKLVERRHIIEDLTDSEADEESKLPLSGTAAAASRRKRSATGSQLVPDDYYIEPEPAFILNVRPKTYGKRLQSSSAQTDQKLTQSHGLLSTSAKSPKRRGVNLLSAAKRRRNKTQMQIPFHEPRPASRQRTASRAKSVELVDSSLESQLEADDMTNDSADEKWRTCTIQTDSDSVTVQYVTISGCPTIAPEQQQQQQQVAADSKANATGGQDDGYVSGSGELKRVAAAPVDQATATSAKSTGLKSGLFLPFCSTSSAAEDDEESESQHLDTDKRKLKKPSKEKKKKKLKKEAGSGKSSPVKLDSVPEAKIEAELEKATIASGETEEDSQREPKGQTTAAEAQLSASEEADESLVTTTTTSRSISPTTKERKQQLKLEKREKLKRDKLERQKQKELDEANAKAAKAQKKLEKEAKRKAEKEEKSAKKANGSKQQSPGGSRAQSPTAAEPVAKQDESGSGGGVLGAITKTFQSVKFAPSPSKDSMKAESDEQAQVTASNQDHEIEDSSMVHVSIGAESNLLQQESGAKPEATSDADQLISFSPEPADAANVVSEQAKVLKPILKQQQSGSLDRDASSSELTEPKTCEPKSLSAIADELLQEATREALQQAQVSSGTSSPTLTNSLSQSKKEAAKRLKAEKDKLKAELKLSADEEKRLAKEAKRSAKLAEEAARKAEHEAKKAALEARKEAERQAEIAKREAEAAIESIETSQHVISVSNESPIDKAELKKQATEAEFEAKKQAKAAKKQAKEAAAQEKAKLTAEKKRAKQGAEPSAPSLEMISESSPEAQSKSSSSEAKQEEGGEVFVAAASADTVDDSKRVPLGLPRVSFDLGRNEPQQSKQAEEQQVADSDQVQLGPKDEVVEPEITAASAEQTLASESWTVSEKSETLADSGPISGPAGSEPKTKDKKRKDKKKQKKGKEANQNSSSDESSAAEVASKSSLLGRLFRIKSKQKTHSSDETSPKRPAEEEAPTKKAADADSTSERQEQLMIVSEMYPSDPNNADGEMILEVNVPEELISEPSGPTQQVERSPVSQHPEPTSASMIATSGTALETTEPTDDQEATLVNLSQIKDDVIDDNDEVDDEATENVLSQANDLAEEAPSSVRGQAEGPSSPGVEAESAGVERSSDELNVAEFIQEDSQQVAEAPEVCAEATAEPLGSSSRAASKELAKDDKARKELEAKLEKEAKKRLKEEEKLRKKEEKAEKKRAEAEAAKQAKEEKKRKKQEAKEAKRAAEQAKREAKKQATADKKNKKSVPEPGTDATGAEPPQGPSQESNAVCETDATKPTTITTTTITSTSTVAGDERALNDHIGRDEADIDSTGRVLMSSVSEVPINEETEVERIVEEVVGEDGTVTKTTKLVETKYVTMRQEEIRVAERRDMPLEEWQRIQAERAASEQPEASTSGDGQSIERVRRAEQKDEPAVVEACSAELEAIRATPSYFDLTTRPAEIKPNISESKALKKRIKLNQKLIKRAYKLAKLEFKKAKRDQRRAEAEIAVCDEAARQARKELKCAVKEAKRAAKLTEKQHKKMDKVDKKLSKRAKELDKRQKKIDKQVAKAAKKQAKRDAKAAKKAAKLARSNSSKSASGSSRSPSRGSKRSLRPEDIGEPVLRSSSRLSIVQNNPNVELSMQQPVELTQAAAQLVEQQQQPSHDEMALTEVERQVELQDSVQVGGESTTTQQVAEHQTIGEAGDERLAGAEVMRSELDAVREEDDDAMINVVDDDDDNHNHAEPSQAPQSSPSLENDAAELADETPSETVSPASNASGKGKKNKRRNKKQKSRESAE